MYIRPPSYSSRRAPPCQSRSPFPPPFLSCAFRLDPLRSHSRSRRTAIHDASAYLARLLSSFLSYLSPFLLSGATSQFRSLFLSYTILLVLVETLFFVVSFSCPGLSRF